jgi:peroxiredoxin-like protein
MHAFPHTYVVRLTGEARGDATVSSDDLPSLRTASPREFDGPGGRWTPEHMLLAAVESCLLLTFRAFARASDLPFRSLDVETTGTLDRVEGVTRFTDIVMHAVLTVPPDTAADRARRILERSEKACLISASLSTPVRLDAVVIVEGVPEPVA